MLNIRKFLDKDSNPTGKILYYSDFRHSGYGSDAFEKILIQNGYERFNSDSADIDELISKKSMKKDIHLLLVKSRKNKGKSIKKHLIILKT